MSKRLFIWLFWPLLAAWALWLLWATHALAQELVYVPSNQHAYTTADPVDPALLGLATTDGRFSIAVPDDCGWVAPGLQVALYFNDDGTLHWIDQMTAAGSAGEPCAIVVRQLMDATPCFTNAEGACDVALEQED